MMMSKWAFILTVAAGVAGGATSASAITFDLTSDHCTGGCGTRAVWHCGRHPGWGECAISW